MHEEIIISGFGGQGIILAGKMLIYACMLEKKHVSHIPSYGIEMRGGAANCSLVVSSDQIGSPLVRTPTTAVLMSEAAFDKYEPMVKAGGTIIVNTSRVTRAPKRTDVTIVNVPCEEIAEGFKQPRSANVAALGALIGASNICTEKSMHATFERMFSRKGNAVVELNMNVLAKGIGQVRA